GQGVTVERSASRPGGKVNLKAESADSPSARVRLMRNGEEEAARLSREPACRRGVKPDLWQPESVRIVAWAMSGGPPDHDSKEDSRGRTPHSPGVAKGALGPSEK